MSDRKIAILLAGSRPARWLVKALELLCEVPHLEPVMLLPEEPITAARNWGPLHGIYRDFCKRRGRIEADRPAPISTAWPVLPCANETIALETLAREKPELILDLGSPWIHSEGFLGKISVPLWHFSQAGNSAATFWDTLSGRDWSSAELRQRLQGKDVVLHRESFRTVPGSYSNTLHKLRQGSSFWPALALQLRRERLTQAELDPEPPGTFGMLRYLARSTVSKLAQRLKPQPAWQEQWAIGLVQQSAGQVLDNGLGPVRWLHPPAGCFAADPFLWRQGAQYFIFFELLRHEAPFGEIAFVSTSDFLEYSSVEVVIGEPGRHWSYPSLIEWEGSTYCIPEHCESNQVRLYRAQRFPRDWRMEAVLLENFPGVDPTVFVHDGRFWMVVADTTSAYDCLHAFHAPALIGPWIAHQNNPIIRSHAHLARPAGRIFESNGKLYRPAQMGHRYYGYGILLHEIQELTPRSYRERPVRCLQPDPSWPYPDGLHQFDTLGQWTVVDAKLHTVDGGRGARKAPGIQLRLSPSV